MSQKGLPNEIVYEKLHLLKKYKGKKFEVVHDKYEGLCN